MEQRIMEIIKEIVPQGGFDESTALVDDGILDSMAIASLISELSLEYDIRIPYDDISEENFNSVSAIATLVKRLQK